MISSLAYPGLWNTVGGEEGEGWRNGPIRRALRKEVGGQQRRVSSSGPEAAVPCVLYASGGWAAQKEEVMPRRAEF